MDSEQLFQLDGKVVVLTGGSGIIGKTLAFNLPIYGAKVIVGVRNTNKFMDLLEQVQLPEGCLLPSCYELNLSDESTIDQFFKKIIENHGKIDVLINSAWPKSKDWGKRFEDVPVESLYKNLCDHSGGYFLCCQHAVNFFKEQKTEGIILNMGSIYGEVGPHFPIYEGTNMISPPEYSLIKGGIHTFTKYLATYLAPFNIRVNCLSPGGIYDSSHQNPIFIENYKKNTPLGRMGEPDDIIGPTIFLISDASRYVTGQILFVDGGWTTW